MENIEKRYLTQKEAEKYTCRGEERLCYLMRGLIIQSQSGGRRIYDKKDIDARMSEVKGKRHHCF